MAITARFEADFSSFQSAVQNAEVSLKGFEDGAGKVGTSLTRMTNSLSGTSIIQQATLMSEAVERVGGVSKLTEAELARVSATAKEAAAKMVAMGVDVPPGIQKIANETRGATTAHGELLSTVKEVALGFAAMFTVHAAYDFVKNTVSQASALLDLSRQTQINVETLQVLSGSMREFGVDAETLGKGLYSLSRKIDGGDASVSTALHLMGMSFKDVEGLHGEELFLKMEHGLSTLQGSLRDTASADLFGIRLGRSMAGAAEGIDSAMEESRRLNIVMSKDSVNALKEFEVAIDRAEHSLSAMAANMIGPVAEGFNVFNDALGRGVSKWAIFKAMVQDAGLFGPFSTNAEHLATLLDHMNIATEAAAVSTKKLAGAHADATVQLSAQAEATRFMASLDADAGAALESWQLKDLAHLKEIGALNAANAAAIGVNAAQLAKYEAATASAKEYADWVTRITKAEHEMYFEMEMFGAKKIHEMTLVVQKEMAAQRDLVMAAQMDIVGILTTGQARLKELGGQGLTGLDAQIDALNKKREADLKHIEQLGRAATDLGGDWASKATEATNQVEEIFQTEFNNLVSGAADSMNGVSKAIGSPAVTGAATTAAGSIRQEFVTSFQAIGAAADSMAARVAAVLNLAAVNKANAGMTGATFGTASTLNAMAARNVGLTIPTYGTGGPVTKDGPIYAHAGEYVLPKGGGGGTSITVAPGAIVINGQGAQSGRDAADAFLKLLKAQGVRM